MPYQTPDSDHRRPSLVLVGPGRLCACLLFCVHSCQWGVSSRTSQKVFDAKRHTQEQPCTHNNRQAHMCLHRGPNNTNHTSDSSFTLTTRHVPCLAWFHQLPSWPGPMTIRPCSQGPATRSRKFKTVGQLGPIGNLLALCQLLVERCTALQRTARAAGQGVTIQ